MKFSNRTKILAALTIVAFVFAACRDYEITTKINPDGSCERVMTVRGDSSEVVRAKFPTPIDSTWTVSFKKADGDDFIYTARKKFESVAKMNLELFNEKGNDVRLNIHSKLEKRFRWFFTLLKYREEYQPLFQKLPITDYLTPEELAVLLEEDEENDSVEVSKDQVEKKVEEWFKKNIFEEFYEIFLAGAEKLNEPALTVELIKSKKNELYKKTDTDTDEVSDLVEAFEEVLKTPAVWKVAEIDSKAFQLFDEKLEFAGSLLWDDYVINISMPGLIIATNAKNIEGNQVSWGDEEGYKIRLLGIGDEKWVESRIVNWWAVYISAAIMLLLLVSIAASLRRRRN